MEVYEFAIRLGAATLAGLLIGLEREWKDKEAGLKTNMLVAIGAAVFVMISLQFYGEKHVDITRVLGQVVVGIGFIGAGTILKKEESNTVKGITTAATIWCSAAAGCVASMGMYWELGILTIVVVIINYIFGHIDKRINKNES
ncbi:MgtC/SapB family protein [Luteirhabdus pelagi]|uniref:MgtC/SapB family protein n=1 Tax=Luteirhabdus pelagi TaxID=2792783 RepID=UPI0019396019|nr:MgtC/SapB family protein [Luteirhabdus pelagi]